MMKFRQVFVPVFMGAFSGLAVAAADTSAVTAAGEDALAYAAAVGGVLISIWAAKLAYRKFFGT